MIHTKFLWTIGVAVLLFAVFELISWDWSIVHFPALPRMRSGAVRPRYIFVDLGANSADSLEVFLGHEDAKFKWDFPRPEWATHDQAEIFLFEANPYFNPALIQAKEEYTKLGHKITIFPSTVVDVKDGTRTFFLDTVNVGHEFWGSSIFAAHPDAASSHTNGTELTSINISRWLLMNTLPQDFVVVKMDIEGSEYEVIPHMAEMSAWLVVDYLFIEWHPVGYLGGTAEENDFRLAMTGAASEKLKAEGVEMPVYESAA